MITVEDAKRDLEKVLRNFWTVGGGTDLDRAAQLVIQPLQVFINRVDKPAILKMLYLDNPAVAELIPQTILDIAAQLCDGKLSQEDARQKINETIQQYREAFQQMGLSPQMSKALFTPA